MSKIRVWIFPAVVVAVFCALMVGNVNGSSVTVLSAKATDAGFFRPQMIRADEWSNATPVAVGLTRQGFPETPFIGLTQTDVNLITPSMPSRTWDQAFRVQLLGYHVLGAERGVAMQWWLPLVISLLGMYLLVLVLTRSLSTAIGLSMIGTFAPTTAWWSNWPALTIGWLCASVALILLALGAASRWRAVAMSLAAGYCAASAVLALYPPWLLTGGIVLGLLLVGILWDARPGWVVSAWAVIPAGVVAALGAGAFVLSNAEPFELLSATIYPGQRTSVSGEGYAALLMNAASSPGIAYGHPAAISNASEISSVWFPGPLLAVALSYLVIVAWSRGPVRIRSGVATGPAVTVSLVISGAILTAWGFLPGIPTVVGRLLLLSSVPSYRMQVALGLWALLVLAVTVNAVVAYGLTRAWRWAFALGGVVTAVVMVGSAVRSVFDAGPLTTVVIVAVSVAFAAACYLLVASARVWGATVLAVLSLGTYALVNPVNVGLGPLVDDPLAIRYQALADESPGSTIAIFGPNASEPMAKAAGLQVLNGQTVYPNPEFWEQVAPDSERLWNNYRNYAWFYRSEGPAAVGRITSPDGANLFVNVCAPEMREDIGVDYVIVRTGYEVECGQKLESFGWRMYGLELHRIPEIR